ncbi:MoaD/ThiS family protein [Parerythrobacter lacustris]|uniref:MoaD/ThiS family protein n=1 Tax=Parerythrobacter lacustris TaxID=2969984 RepID=A0ABT1XTX9_9SPHN|nr:MoaD/ThiS family protein [Parerythrobacter lacustris]MCR2835120.1 MoaD/ThiS family protein [Parerythrobacter lacustris]
MAIRILFLGPLRDLAGCEEMTAAAPLDWAGLLKLVGQDVAEVLAGDRIHLACGGRVLANKTELSAQDGDEVALLPPVSGG